MTGPEFRALRHDAGFSQEQVASEAGWTASYICLIESGRRPVSEKMERNLLRALESLAAKASETEQEERHKMKLADLGAAVLELTKHFKSGHAST